MKSQIYFGLLKNPIKKQTNKQQMNKQKTLKKTRSETTEIDSVAMKNKVAPGLLRKI